MQLETTPYNKFPKVNGSMQLEQAQYGETSSDVLSRFDNEGTAMSLLVSPYCACSSCMDPFTFGNLL